MPQSMRICMGRACVSNEWEWNEMMVVKQAQAVQSIIPKRRARVPSGTSHPRNPCRPPPRMNNEGRPSIILRP